MKCGFASASTVSIANAVELPGDDEVKLLEDCTPSATYRLQRLLNLRVVRSEIKCRLVRSTRANDVALLRGRQAEVIVINRVVGILRNALLERTGREIGQLLPVIHPSERIPHIGVVGSLLDSRLRKDQGAVEILVRLGIQVGRLFAAINERGSIARTSSYFCFASGTFFCSSRIIPTTRRDGRVFRIGTRSLVELGFRLVQSSAVPHTPGRAWSSRPYSRDRPR